MNKPNKVPQPVVDAINRWAKNHPRKVLQSTGEVKEIACPPTPQWDALNGCYYFVEGGLYVGIELDGYLHT